MTTNARPAPAWDEEAVVEAVARRLHADACSEHEYDWEQNAGTFRDQARELLAVVRERLPVKPVREDIYRAWHGTDDPWGGCADRASIERVLDLLPGRSEAEVKAGSLREFATAALAQFAADGNGPEDTITVTPAFIAGIANTRADRLAAEGGDDR